MPRGPRKVYNDAYLHVISRGNNKRIIFRKEKDYMYFKELLLKYVFRYKLTIYHYCLMRNHIHLLLKTLEPVFLSKAMQGVQLSYFNYFRKRYGYVGRFWQGRFLSKIIKDDRQLMTTGLYIEANPIRKKFVKEPGECKYSSYNIYASGHEDPLIRFDPYFYTLGDEKTVRQTRYKELMLDYLASKNDHS